MHLQFTFLKPLDIFGGLISLGRLKCVLAQGNCDETVVGTIPAFDQQTVSLENCADNREEAMVELVRSQNSI